MRPTLNPGLYWGLLPLGGQAKPPPAWCVATSSLGPAGVSVQELPAQRPCVLVGPWGDLLTPGLLSVMWGSHGRVLSGGGMRSLQRLWASGYALSADSWMEAGGPLASGRVEAGGGGLMGSLLSEAPVPGPGVPAVAPKESRCLSCPRMGMPPRPKHCVSLRGSWESGGGEQSWTEARRGAPR